jgi:hypothetical protein
LASEKKTWRQNTNVLVRKIKITKQKKITGVPDGAKKKLLSGKGQKEVRVWRTARVQHRMRGTVKEAIERMRKGEKDIGDRLTRSISMIMMRRCWQRRSKGTRHW